MGKKEKKEKRKKHHSKDSDSYSNMSAPGPVDKKPPRFSLRRIFAGRTLSAKSNRSRTSIEIDTNSELSLTNSQFDKIGLQVSTDMGQVLATTSESDGVSPSGTLVCPLCISELPQDCFPLLMTCPHRSCQDCLKQYLRIEITESRVNISCPECSERLHPGDIKSILSEDSLMEKYEEFMLRRVLVSDPDARWCPAPDCGYAVIATGCAGCPKLKCERPGCESYFCYHCKQHWHPNLTCDAARARRSPSLRVTSKGRNLTSTESTAEIKPCPRCSACIMKMDDGSCNHMTCAVCGAEFCWLCMKEISDLHYLSPSGCTFWGKKPWSRKKKILWQLGTLVGAPVGIGLIAGIAVPAMIIGIPIWVARKLHAKYETLPKHKRNAIIAGGVTASIIVSPIVAGLAVGVGVPILLAYVYGVVPISLCRSGGGCGVKTTESGGVRFDFDDDNEVTVGGSSAGPGGDGQGIEVNSQHAITEPSIGPSIGEASVDMTKSLSASGSHVDRIGIIRDESDRDSSSNRAIAGASLDGSLSGSAVLGNKLEVHADVANCQKRASISSETANLSLGSEKSHNAVNNDNASTKALAGSIGGHRDTSSGVIPPMEGQADQHKQRRNSGGSNITTGSHHRAMSNSGSPISGRSISFSGEENKNRRGRKFKRCSFSGVDRNSIDGGERMDKLSIGSCDLDTDHTDTTAVLAKPAVTEDKKGSSPRSSASFDSVDSRSVVATSVATLTQVEVDKPQYAVRTISKTLKEDNALIEGPVLCNIVEERKPEVGATEESIRVRRMSCEMALDQGRLVIDSPYFFQC